MAAAQGPKEGGSTTMAERRALRREMTQLGKSVGEIATGGDETLNRGFVAQRVR